MIEAAQISPEAGPPNHAPMPDVDGRVSFDYETQVYDGQLAARLA